MNARPTSARPSATRRPRPPAAGRPAQPIALAEFADRRARVLAALDGAAAVVFAGESSPGSHGPFRPDAHFLYLTGIADEAGAAVVFNPAAENPDHRIVLLLRPIDPEADRWDGLRDTLTAAMRRRLGFTAVLRTTRLPTLISTAARRAGTLACLHPFAGANSPVSPDLALFRKVTERTPGVTIIDRTQVLPSMRAVKSASEQALMRAAAAATAEGYARALRALRPGVNEFDVQRELEAGYLAGGADSAAHGSAYDPIVGAGINGAVLHYHANTARCEDGDLVVIDSGARVHGYCCDVTRTLPACGRFSPEQRELYALVLKAQHAALKAARPGASLWQLEAAARRVFTDAGESLLDAFVHSIGHQLGLEVHDATPDGPLKAGMVITIEPGVYFTDRRLGIRIEDSVLITARGAENLTARIPTSITEIEHAMNP